MIPRTFTKYGETFEMLLSGHVHMIYKRGESYEVIRPVVMRGELIYPSASMWGVYGWTYNKLEDAVIRMNDKDEEFIALNNAKKACTHENTEL